MLLEYLNLYQLLGKHLHMVWIEYRICYANAKYVGCCDRSPGSWKGSFTGWQGLHPFRLEGIDLEIDE